MPDYHVCTRAIEGGSFSSEPGPTRFLKVPDKTNSVHSHEINRTTFIEEVVGKPSAKKCQDIVVFVHGYNATKADLIQRHRSIRTDLAKTDYKVEVLSFDWPAKGNCAKNNNPYDSVLTHSTVKRIGVAPRAGRVGLPDSAPAKAFGDDCGARFLKLHPTTKPVFDRISHGWYFDDPVFLKDLTFTLVETLTEIPSRHA